MPDRHDSNRQSRRTVLRLVAAMAAAAGGSGAAIADRDGDPFPSYDPPRYSDWVPTESRDESAVVFTHLDWKTLTALEDDEGDTEDEDDEVPDDDTLEDDAEIPILGLPLYGAIVTLVGFFQILFYPFAGDILSGDEEGDVEGIDTDTMSWIEEIMVFHGTYDPDVFEERYADGFEVDDERDGFTVYVGTGGFTEDMAYAVSEATVVVGVPSADDDDENDGEGETEGEEFTPTDAVYEALDRFVGDRERLVGTDDGRWLFETTGEAPMSFGVWKADDLTEALDPADDDEAGDDGDEADEDEPDVEDNPVFDEVESLINTLLFTVDDGEASGLEARFSGLYPEAAVPTEDQIREHLIAEDVPHEIIVDGTRVHATAAVEEESPELRISTERG